MVRSHALARCFAGLLLMLALGACRADDGQCRVLTHHIVEIAESEGQGGSTVSLENDCKATRPTKKMVACMMDATTIAEIEAC